MEGMQETLIGQLSQVSALRVISRRSTLRYRGSHLPAGDIARELEVEGLVEATILRTGDSMEVQVQLVEALPEERSRWAHTYIRGVFKRAYALNPSLTFSHFHYAWYLALAGRLDQALEEHLKARDLDPLTPPQLSNLGSLYLYRREYAKAAYEAHQALELASTEATGLAVLGLTHLLQHQIEEAIPVFETMASYHAKWRWLLGRAYAEAGRRREALAIRTAMEAEPPSSWNAIGLVVLNTALGDYDEAFRWLDYEPHHAWVPWLTVDPMLIAPRNDPRFAAFVARLKLPPPPGAKGQVAVRGR